MTYRSSCAGMLLLVLCASRASGAPSFVPTRVSEIPLPLPTLVGRMALSPDGGLAAIAGADGLVVLYDLRGDRVVHTLRHGQKPVRDVVFADARQVVSGGADGRVLVFDTQRGTRLRVLRARGAPVRQLAVGAGLVAVAAEEPALRLYPLDGGSAKTLRGHRGWVRCVAFSGDGTRLVSGGHDLLVRVWSIPKGKLERTLSGHTLWVSALALSRDGSLLASAGFENRIRLWHVADGTSRGVLAGHVLRAGDLAFDDTGQTLASASLDRTAIIWRRDAGGTFRLQHVLSGHRHQVTTARFAAQARVVVTASGDGSLRLYPLPLPQSPSTTRWPKAHPRDVTLRAYTSGERLRVRLTDESGEVRPEAIAKLGYFLRSGPDDSVRPPEAKLVKLFDRIVAHFGRHREVVVISGFRSAEFNKLRTQQSRQVAKDSQHLQGAAIDFRISGVSVTTLYKYARKLRAGGVGIYYDSQFIHIDSGRVRTWTGN